MGSKQWGYIALFAAVVAAVATGGVSAGLIAASPTISSIALYATAVSFAASLVAQRFAKKEARAAANESLRDRVQTIRASDEPRAIVYGRQRVGGVLTFVSKPFGAKLDQVTLVTTLAGHPCDAIETIWINDEPVSLQASGNSWIVIGSPSGRWNRLRSEMLTIEGTAPAAVWNAGSPSANRITVFPNTFSIVSFAYLPDGSSAYATAQPDIDYLVIPNSYDIGIINPAILGRPYTVTCRLNIASAGNIVIRMFTGYETGSARRDTDLETNSGGEWKSTATGDDICRLHITLKYDETTFAEGVPNFSAIVRGRRIYDPRLDSTNGGSGSQRYTDPTTWTWSRNAALCARDYLTHEWGLAVANARVDDATVIAAANACDVLMTIRNLVQEAQFTVDGFVSTSESPLDNLDELCGAMGGFCAPSGGKWRMAAGAWAAPAADAKLYDKDAIGDIEITTFLEAADVYNAVRGRYRDETTYAVTDYPPFASATYIAADGAELYNNVDLPLTTNAIRAQRVAKLSLFRARQSLTVVGTFTVAAWRYQAGDRLRLMLTEYGWDAVSQDGGSGKIFRVIDRQWVFPDQVRLTLVEDASAIYAWNYNEATQPDPTPNTTLPSPSIVNAPANFIGSATASDFVELSDGTRIGHILLTWDAVTDSGVLAGGWLELRWKRTSEPASMFRIVRITPVATEYRLEGIAANEILNIGLTAVNASQARSSITPIRGNVDGLANGVFSVQAGFVVSAGGTLFSGNLLQNSTWQFDTNGWYAFDLATFSTANISGKVGSALALIGPPMWSAVMQEQSAGATASTAISMGFTHSAAARCQPGERFCFVIGLDPIDCDAVPGIAFYRLDDSLIPDSVSVGEKMTRAYQDARLQSSYERRAVFATAPAGAARVRGIVYKYGTKSPAATSQLFFAGPDLRELVGADVVPPFAVGSHGLVTTPAIDTEAVTIVREVVLPNETNFSTASGVLPLLQADFVALGALPGDAVRWTITGVMTVPASTSAKLNTVGVTFAAVNATDALFGTASRQQFTFTGSLVSWAVPDSKRGNPRVGLYAVSNNGTCTVHAATINVEIIKR